MSWFGINSWGCVVLDVFDAVKKRRSVRRFLEESIEAEKLNVVLEAGRLAPYARNLQEWRFVVMDPKVKRKIAMAANCQVFVGQALVVIVGCAITDGRVICCG